MGNLLWLWCESSPIAPIVSEDSKSQTAVEKNIGRWENDLFIHGIFFYVFAWKLFLTSFVTTNPSDFRHWLTLPVARDAAPAWDEAAASATSAAKIAPRKGLMISIPSVKVYYE